METLAAVILTLDAGAADAVRRLRRIMAEKLVDDGLDELHAEPHVTLAVYEGLAPSALLPIVQAFAPRLTRQPVSFPGLGIFPGDEAVLYLAPKVEAPLLALHADYHRLAAGQAHCCHAEFQPERWVPHCTLAARLKPADLPRAVAAVNEAWSPIDGSLSGLALVGFPPVRRLYHRTLAPAA